MSLIPSWKVVEQFEERMAEYCEAPYAVAVDTCTAAMFLCMQRERRSMVVIPSRTYLGVACAAKHAGVDLRLCDFEWRGIYPLSGTNIYDCACRLRRGMFEWRGVKMCLSFQSRKHLKIGRGGMILTDDEADAAWFRKARFLGRAEHNGEPEFIGWHCFMEPERAARGLQLMDSLPDDNPDLVFDYPDLRTYKVFQ